MSLIEQGSLSALIKTAHNTESRNQNKTAASQTANFFANKQINSFREQLFAFLIGKVKKNLELFTFLRDRTQNYLFKFTGHSDNASDNMNDNVKSARKTLFFCQD